ncbi:histidine phosphatase family protein [Arthrobacter crystallopoietes]|uniref:histidine phosphatase family protein n=1 Tax=Micrococcaceae TaxID=1268 RepID=UPI0021C75C4B|nr:histidine phosphatase family protein [Arthrobacter sp. Marseille-P9274]
MSYLPVSNDYPKLWLVRHGETEWSRSGQYTGLTDLELTENGVLQAREAGRKLSGLKFSTVLSSPLKRAVRTAELAGFSDPEIVPYAHEWDYGEYEGLRSAEIRAKDPSYLIWTHGVRGGETLEQVADRADHVIAKVLDSPSEPPFQPDPIVQRNVLLVAHGHFLRVLAARWLDLPPVEGRRFVLDTAAVCSLGWDKQTPAVTGWNI